MIDEDAGLTGAKILILEDDYYQADDLQSTLEHAGATIVGPFCEEQEACAAVAAESLDLAFIDVNLGRGPSFAVAHDLAERAVPFVFVTGYDAGVIPDTFRGVSRLEKPVDARMALRTALRLWRGQG